MTERSVACFPPNKKVLTASNKDTIETRRSCRVPVAMCIHTAWPATQPALYGETLSLYSRTGQNIIAG